MRKLQPVCRANDGLTGVTGPPHRCEGLGATVALLHATLDSTPVGVLALDLQQRVAALQSQPERVGLDSLDLLDGRRCERHVSPLCLQQHCVGTVIVWRDVTERRQAEQLRLDRDVAQAASQAKWACLSRMRHALRTPLHAILGLPEVLQLAAGQPLEATGSSSWTTSTTPARTCCR